MPRTTAGSRPPAPLTPHAARTAPSTAPPARTGASRPSMRDVPGRPKQSAEQRGEPVAVAHGRLGRLQEGQGRAQREVPPVRGRQGRHAVDHQVRPGRAVRVHSPALGGQAALYLHQGRRERRPVPAVRRRHRRERHPGQAGGLLQRHRPQRRGQGQGVGDDRRPHPQGHKQYDLLADMEPARTLDDPGFYFAVSKSQKDRSAWEYEVERIKVRDLQEDWSAEPLGDDEFTEATGEAVR